MGRMNSSDTQQGEVCQHARSRHRSGRNEHCLQQGRGCKLDERSSAAESGMVKLVFDP